MRIPAICVSILLVGAGATGSQASDAGDRDHRLRCTQIVSPAGSFDIPSAYSRVTEPGGMIEIRQADGSAWHPAPADVQVLGARIETNPTDNFSDLPLALMQRVPVTGGTIYSRVDCSVLKCLFRVGFVPADKQSTADECGVWPSYLAIDGASEHGLAAARRAIQFRWGPGDNARSLADLVATR